VVLAPDASAFMVSEAAEREGRWRSRIHLLSSPSAPLVVAEDEYFEPQYLSAGGKYLVYWSFGNSLRVVDLGSPELVRHEQAHADISRYQCVLAVLKEGQIVVADARTPRFAVYAATRNVPRISTLEHEGRKHCSVLNANTTSHELVLRGDNGRDVLTLDLRTPDHPRISSTWSVPANTHAIGAAGGFVFTVADRELYVLRADVPVTSAFAWPTLETAYRDAMGRYHRQKKVQQPIPDFDAVRRLEDAGVLDALDSPIVDIAPSQAAAVLNDYGFLAARAGDNQVAERFLKRAVAVDPKRAVAYLNLADLQRATLSQYAIWDDKVRRSREAAANYRTYIALGGKTTRSIASFLKGDLAAQGADDHCRVIANYANAGRLEELVSWGATGVPLGGRRVDLVFTTQGTAHVPVFFVFDAVTDEPLAEPELLSLGEFENLWGGDQLAMLTHGSGFHILVYRDLAHPVTTVSLSDGRRCEFSAVVTQTVGPSASEPVLCESLKANRGRKGLKFDGPVWTRDTDVSARWPESSIAGAGMIDFANDGKPGNLAKLDLASGAGPGCGETFFDLLDKSGTRFESGSRRDLLMKLQGAVPEDRYPLPCGSESSFFRYRGKTYFQNRPQGWPPRDSSQHYHRVARVEQGRVADVCDFKFKARVEVKR